MLRRLACAIGWHVPKLRSDAYGYYRGCVYCAFADTQPLRSALPRTSKGVTERARTTLLSSAQHDTSPKEG